MGDYAFRGCEALTDVTFGNSVEEIGRYAFYGCTSLESVKLPNSLKKLDDYAFRNCNALKSIIIPQTVTAINKHVFNGCNNLTIYTEYTERPTLWLGHWNSSNRPVIWGCELSEDKSYVVSFEKNATSILNEKAVNGISAPTCEGYTFAGWSTTEGGNVEYTMENLTSVENGTKLYAVWQKNQ